MGKRHIALDYRQLSSEDQRTFNRWLTANAIAGAVFAAGIVAMALIGSRSVGPHGAAVASSTKGSDTCHVGAAPEAIRRGEHAGTQDATQTVLTADDYRMARASSLTAAGPAVSRLSTARRECWGG